MAEIRVIVLPYELGRLRGGVGRGPERLLELGGAEALAASGARIETELIELSQPFDNEVDASFELIRLVAERVRAARAADAFPVLVSGSCFAGVGVVAGLEQAAPGVVWFDAHGDFNEPASAVFGYFDGMGLAVLTAVPGRRFARRCFPSRFPRRRWCLREHATSTSPRSSGWPTHGSFRFRRPIWTRPKP